MKKSNNIMTNLIPKNTLPSQNKLVFISYSGLLRSLLAGVDSQNNRITYNDLEKGYFLLTSPKSYIFRNIKREPGEIAFNPNFYKPHKNIVEFVKAAEENARANWFYHSNFTKEYTKSVSHFLMQKGYYFKYDESNIDYNHMQSALIKSDVNVRFSF
jgi:hypothetical protein